ncbi:hypothetical protein LTR96_010646 [Exophiala xenobiotica]|nr:hypothetical protein LTR92_005152 [Exophiala xenobiotica]KAK5263928.1 hypothetical protein LTR96_010646 [Exophiala xenobiotica]KAK5340980.1 hypothetical protein LTR98_001772 [Exophiala xenobiotica]
MDSSSPHIDHHGSNAGMSTYGGQHNHTNSSFNFTNSGGHSLKTLYTNDYRSDRAEVNVLDGTCGWILNTPEFKSWTQDNSSPVLYVVGCPGVGKTVLAEFLIRDLEGRGGSEERTIYFFCGPKQDQPSAASILSSLIHQCVVKVDRIWTMHVGKSCKSLGEKLCSSFGELWSIFRNIMSDAQFGNWYCVLDALDECKEDDRKRLLDKISENFSLDVGVTSASQNQTRLRLLITSRPNGAIKSRLSRLRGSQILDFNDTNGTAKNKSDIDKFIEHGVDNLSGYEEELQKSLKEGLIEKADGNFRWTACMLEALAESLTRNDERLWDHRLPKVDAMFGSLVSGLEAELRSFLEWVALAYRHLSVTELSLALLMDSDEPSHASRLAGDQGAVKQRIILLGGAVKVRKVDQIDHVHLLHPTMKDYLKAHWQELHFDYRKIHLKLGRACLNYLSSDRLKRGPLESRTKAGCPDAYQKLLATLPFLDYAARHWSRHLRDAGFSDSDICGQIYESLATTSHRQLSFQVHQFSNHQEYVQCMSCLHVLAHHDLDFLELDDFCNLIKRCVRAPGSGQNAIDATDASDRTALWLAAEKDRKAMAEILLRCGADPNLMDRDRGRSPLLVAAQNGHLEIVKILLQNENVDRGSKDCDGRNVLSWAAALGHVDVVTLLLQHEEIRSTKNIADRHHDYGQTPLLWAARKGHKGCAEVVDILLKYGADPNMTDSKEGRSALSWAAGNGNEGIVELLLSQADTDLLLEDREGWTSFRWAAYHGQRTIAVAILDKLHTRKRSDWGALTTQLLMKASKRGDVAQLDILLQRHDIDPNAEDDKARTALSWAARSGHGEFVRRLLDDERVRVNLKDNQNRTALMWAALKGRVEETKLLLDCPGIDINGKDVKGKTALQLADSNGHGARFQQLMKERRAGHSRT